MNVQVSCQVGYRRLMTICKAQSFKSSFTVFDDILHKKEEFNTNIKKKDAHTCKCIQAPGNKEVTQCGIVLLHI